MEKSKNILLVIFFLTNYLMLFSQSRYVGDFLTFSLDKDKITVEEMDPFSGVVNTVEYNGIMIEQEPLSIFQCEENALLYILKSEDIAIVYDKNSQILFWGAGRSKYKSNELFLIGDMEYTASSELSEGSKLYAAFNLGNLRLDEPWCEAESDAGIGVTIDLGTCGRGLLFSNGYVSEKSYLYTYNNRVKQIELIDANDASYFRVITLKDTALPQYITIDEQIGRHIILKITDVYTGSKWNDTCINFLIKIL